MIKMSLSEFINENQKLSTNECLKCKSPVELIFEPYHIKIDARYIKLYNFAKLCCIQCGKSVLTEKSKIIVMQIHKDMVENKKFGYLGNYKNLNNRYCFCENYNLLYDYQDYENIPWLMRPWNDGFLTPVFFNKECLIYFMHHPDYRIDLFSNTYGLLRYKNEFDIPFEINSNEKVVMWLGDLKS